MFCDGKGTRWYNISEFYSISDMLIGRKCDKGVGHTIFPGTLKDEFLDNQEHIGLFFI